MEFVSFMVNKSGGLKEIYDRTKIERSILKACNKRDISPQQIDTLLNSLEIEWASNKQGVTSKRIGKDVLYKLIHIDAVAAIRFASVYANFDTPQDFTKFIQDGFDS